MRANRAFSLLELLVVISIIALMMAALLPALGAARKKADQLRAMAHVRGIHQAMVMHAQSNNAYLPGLSRGGEILADSPGDTGGSGPGHTASARLWIVLVNHYLAGDMLISPVEARARWTEGPVTTAHHSYAMLRIAEPLADAGRRNEWKDHSNSRAVLMSDRNIGADAADGQVQSLWTVEPGDWRGVVLWGDNHVEFALSNREFSTRYHTATSTNDNLFADAHNAPAGASEASEDPAANAVMVWD